ncbi:hypothetical protein VCHA49P379_230002 [Vibrio chagasii]|nr:hypothetical protein VCHA49P379_230002 [Vibrio chagasii]
MNQFEFFTYKNREDKTLTLASLYCDPLVSISAIDAAYRFAKIKPSNTR